MAIKFCEKIESVIKNKNKFIIFDGNRINYFDVVYAYVTLLVNNSDPCVIIPKADYNNFCNFLQLQGLNINNELSYDSMRVIEDDSDSFKIVNKKHNWNGGTITIPFEKNKNNHKFYAFWKRVLDIIASFFAILLLSPIFLLIMFCYIFDNGPIFFLQDRFTKNGKTFKMIKFRTMIVNAETQGVYSDNNDKRITKLGKFLRKTSLDELPQLFNIFIGQMSFIGPRPILLYHPWKYDEYLSYQKEIFFIRPGITGWAQINGRRTVEWHKRIIMNCWYVKNMSLWLDIEIFFKTIFKTIFQSDNENAGPTVKGE